MLPPSSFPFSPGASPPPGSRPAAGRAARRTPAPVTPRRAGFTLLEVLVVLAILGIIAALGVWSYLAARTPARDAARTVHAHLLTLRSQAMSNTQARRLVLTAGQELVLQSALRCSETDQSRWTRLGGVTLPPPSSQVTLAAAGPLPPDPTVPGDTRLVVCFGPRGLAEPGGSDDAARFLTLRDHKRTYRLEVALNGAVRTRVE